ncbi:hypothetical protein B0H19DRAFT_1133920 [Mycena capillaripes]|nr:hypothetical protein B0H19DRAFT_1133920 [Mycena capillaripes]
MFNRLLSTVILAFLFLGVSVQAQNLDSPCGATGDPACNSPLICCDESNLNPTLGSKICLSVCPG